MTRINPRFWAGRRVLVTGHTGFKGTWLASWLLGLEAELHGFALPPADDGAFFAGAGLDGRIVEHGGDICEREAVVDAVQAAAPEVVIHLAAQPLVQHSFVDPIGTFATNTLGTAHLLEGVRRQPSCRVVIIVTSDKCYAPGAALRREDDALGGEDPYSASKACAELVATAYRHSFEDDLAGVGIATARAGNVIGAGDWSARRLFPDIARARRDGAAPRLRHVASVRPWQHVLEPLAGYLLLAESLFQAPRTFSGAWNFGPAEEDAWSVGALAALACERLGIEPLLDEQAVDRREVPELRIGSDKARIRLGWRPVWGVREAVWATADGYLALLQGEPPATVVAADIAAHQHDAEAGRRRSAPELDVQGRRTLAAAS